MTHAARLPPAPASPGGPSRVGLRGSSLHRPIHSTGPMEIPPGPVCFAARIVRGACSVIQVSGELDLAGVPVLEAAVRDLELASARDAVLDLRRLVFIDAAGLNAVLKLYADCLNVATTLTIIPGPPSVQRLFELTRLDRLLPFSRP